MIAGPDQGVAGSTACAFGTAPGDENAPHERGVEGAKPVRFELSESGYRLLGER